MFTDLTRSASAAGCGAGTEGGTGDGGGGAEPTLVPGAEQPASARAVNETASIWRMGIPSIFPAILAETLALASRDVSQFDEQHIPSFQALSNARLVNETRPCRGIRVRVAGGGPLLLHQFPCRLFNHLRMVAIEAVKERRDAPVHDAMNMQRS